MFNLACTNVHFVPKLDLVINLGQEGNTSLPVFLKAR